MSDEKRYKVVYDEYRQKGTIKCSYGTWRTRQAVREVNQRRADFHDRKIRIGG